MPYFIADETREELEQKDEEIDRLRQRVAELEAENHAIDGQMRKLRLDVAIDGKDAERYRWGLEHPSLMANFFIKWKTNHEHYNHKNPGVHPSEAIDAAMEAGNE